MRHTCLNELIVDAYGEQPLASSIEHKGGTLFDVQLPDCLIRVDFPGHGKVRPTPCEALAYGLCFFDEQLADTKISFWERFRDTLPLAKLLAAKGWVAIEMMAEERARHAKAKG